MTFSCGGALSSDERHLHAEDDDRMLIYKNSQETGPMPHAAPDIFTVTFHNRFCFFLFVVAHQTRPLYICRVVVLQRWWSIRNAGEITVGAGLGIEFDEQTDRWCGVC